MPEHQAEFNYLTDPARGRTAANLVMTFNREAKSSARYTLYAKKAAESGYATAGALFSACAASEQIHAVRHAKAALFMGVSLEVKIDPVVDEHVPDMLGKMLAFETMAGLIYPDLIEDALQEGYELAVLSFKHAMLAKKVHILLCQHAIDSGDYWKSKRKVFYVCSLCGCTRTVNQGLCECCGGSTKYFNAFPPVKTT
ncbi:MAG: ferritin family protein [Thermoguttaceae bacterium]|nr:ferritin family protein [Thermoguttaceae bacterium]